MALTEFDPLIALTDMIEAYDGAAYRPPLNACSSTAGSSASSSAAP